MAKNSNNQNTGFASSELKKELVISGPYSAKAYSQAIKIDQLQRRLTNLSLSPSPAASKIAKEIESQLSDLFDHIEGVMNKLNRTANSNNRRKASQPKNRSKPSPAAKGKSKASSKKQATSPKKQQPSANADSKPSPAAKSEKSTQIVSIATSPNESMESSNVSSLPSAVKASNKD